MSRQALLHTMSRLRPFPLRLDPPLRRWAAPGLAALCVLAVACPAGAQDELASNDRMRRVVTKFVGRTGESVIGLGSWISGKAYRDPLQGGSSDHDLRLLLPRGTSAAAARSEYYLARQRLVELIRAEFGPHAGRVLRTVNLYPPTQLMKGVETAEDAVERFVKIGMAPNLSHEGRITTENAGRVAEGLYGESAEAWTQQYERDAGRLFYQERGIVQTGMTDLTHLSEGEARYTLRGMANTAAQWSEHLDDALRAGDPTKVAKYLSRLDRDLAKAKSLARCGLSPELRDEMRALMAQCELKPSAARMEQITGQILAISRRARVECAILARIDRAGAVQRELLRALLGGSSVADDLARAFGKAVEAAGDLPWEKGLNGLLAAVAVWQVSGKGGEEGAAAAMKEAMPWLFGLGPGIAMGLTDALLDWAKDRGYAWMASSQDAWDLMAGIYSAVGRADVEDRVGSWTLDTLVQKIHDPNKLSRLVMARATIASARGFGGATSNTGRADSRLAEVIFARCYPVILNAWRAKREMLFLEYADICDALARRRLTVIATPSTARWKRGAEQVVIGCAALTTGGPFDAEIARARAIILTISGLKPTHSITYNWTPAGRAVELAYQRRQVLLRPGRHLLQATRVIRFTAYNAPRSNNIDRTVSVTAAVEVELKAEKAPTQVLPARATAPPPPKRPAEGGAARTPEGASGDMPGEPAARGQTVSGSQWVLDSVVKKEFDLLGKRVTVTETETHMESTRVNPIAGSFEEKHPTMRIDLAVPPATVAPGTTLSLQFAGDFSQLLRPVTSRLPEGKAPHPGWLSYMDANWTRTAQIRFPTVKELDGTEMSKKIILTVEFDLWAHDYYRIYCYVLK